MCKLKFPKMSQVTESCGHAVVTGDQGPDIVVEGLEVWGAFVLTTLYCRVILGT